MGGGVEQHRGKNTWTPCSWTTGELVAASQLFISTSCHKFKHNARIVTTICTQAEWRIQFNGTWAGTDGQQLQGHAVAQSARLVWESMLHCLREERVDMHKEVATSLTMAGQRTEPDRLQITANWKKQEQLQIDNYYSCCLMPLLCRLQTITLFLWCGYIKTLEARMILL